MCHGDKWTTARGKEERIEGIEPQSIQYVNESYSFGCSSTQCSRAARINHFCPKCLHTKRLGLMTVLRVLLVRAVYNNAMEIRIDDSNKVTASFFSLSSFTVFTSYRKLDNRHDMSTM